MLKEMKDGTPLKRKGLAESLNAGLFHPVSNLSEIGEEELSSLVRRRAQPGILILNIEGEILYLNDDAGLLLQKLMTKTTPPTDMEKAEKVSFSRREKDKNSHQAGPSSAVLPEIILQLYQNFSTEISLEAGKREGREATSNRICIQGGMVYLLRALPLQRYHSESAQRDLMILIERVSQGLRTDQIVAFAKLTPRENEVVHLLLEGKTNKEIAVCINIGEYTVKDHIKRIMRKHGVTTRAGIVAKVLQSHFPAASPLV